MSSIKKRINKAQETIKISEDKTYEVNNKTIKLPTVWF